MVARTWPAIGARIVAATGEAIGIALGVALGLASAAPAVAAAPTDADLRHWQAIFAREVNRRLDVPADARRRYAEWLDAALAASGRPDLPPQAVLLVDRSEQVQAAAVLLRTAAGGWAWLGATPASTGRVGAYEHFRTPLGVFDNDDSAPDFRAEGTPNAHGIRGYGARGLRVFDFGWVEAERGWGDGGRSAMRLQVHATDPVRLEPRLGQAASKGCIRIPATLNVFLDRRGVLDAELLLAPARGARPWVLRADRDPLPWPGRYLVVVDSGARERPPWSPPPGAALAAAAPAPATAC